LKTAAASASMPHTVLLELLDGERPTPPVLNGVEIVAPTDGEIAADLHLQAVLRFNRRCWSGSPKPAEPEPISLM
jgi:hypothetical protein